MKNNKHMKITVVGLGYVGLPTALAFHRAGFSVTGIDVSDSVIEILNRGEHHLVEETSNLEIPVMSERWNVTTKFKGSIEDSDLILITVPTPITSDKKPNLSYVEAACKSVLENITKGKTTIILESTVYPGVTRNVLTQISDEIGLEVGIDFNFGYSPERVSPGDVGRSSAEVAKIVGMDDEVKGYELAEIYSKITSGGCTYVGSPEVAEAAKLIENTQRDIDIAFANELAIVLPKMGLDVEDVLNAASTKWNFHRHTPGIGIGGHCIPVDPYFYIEISEKLGFKSLMSTAARNMNNKIEDYSANVIMDLMDKHNLEDLVFLGYSYKPNVGDIRETPVEKICKEIFEKRSINPFIWDPLINKKDIPNWINFLEDLDELSNRDALIVIGTAHQVVIEIDYSELKERIRKPVIYDGRRALNLDNLEKQGWAVYAIGKP